VDCEVIYDFLAIGGILIPKGTTARVLRFESNHLWIDVYIDEIGEPIPIPISYFHIRLINPDLPQETMCY
jgi:hypothetical protein